MKDPIVETRQEAPDNTFAVFTDGLNPAPGSLEQRRHFCCR